MRKSLIVLIILGFCSVTQAEPPGQPVMLEAARDHKAWEAQERAKKEAEKSFITRIYEQIMAKLGFTQDESKKKTYRKDVVPEIFVQDNCEDCRKLERFFEDNKMPYIRYDIQRELKGTNIYNSLGVKSMPLTRVGTTVVKGFNPQRIEVLMAP